MGVIYIAIVGLLFLGGVLAKHNGWFGYMKPTTPPTPTIIGYNPTTGQPIFAPPPSLAPVPGQPVSNEFQYCVANDNTYGCLPGPVPTNP